MIFDQKNKELTREIDRFIHVNSISDLNFINVSNFKDRIILNYVVKDDDLEFEYKFEVTSYLINDREEIQYQTPVLKLLSPSVKVNLDIHMLMNGIICFTFPGDIRYNQGLTCGYAVEQSFKWAFGYEFYLKKHYWPFPEMPHGIYPIHWGFSRPQMAA